MLAGVCVDLARYFDLLASRSRWRAAVGEGATSRSSSSTHPEERVLGDLGNRPFVDVQRLVVVEVDDLPWNERSTSFAMVRSRSVQGEPST
jgi:hypothetical protein